MNQMSEKSKRIEFSDRIEYRLNGKLHREDGPAIERTSGTKEWYFNGKLHRLDGPADAEHRQAMPAVERANGHKSWFIDGKLHRLGGPAIESTDGYKEWWRWRWSITKWCIWYNNSR